MIACIFILGNSGGTLAQRGDVQPWPKLSDPYNLIQFQIFQGADSKWILKALVI